MTIATPDLLYRLYHLIIEEGLTQQQAADRLGLRRSQVRGLCYRNRYLSGRMGRPVAAQPTERPPRVAMPTPVRPAQMPIHRGHPRTWPFDLEDTDEL